MVLVTCAAAWLVNQLSVSVPLDCAADCVFVMLPDENVYLQAKCTLDKDGVQEAATMDENKPVTAGVPDVVDLTL